MPSDEAATCTTCGQETVNDQKICGPCAMEDFRKSMIMLWERWVVK